MTRAVRPASSGGLGLLERDRELGLAAELIEGVLAGHGAALCLLGPAGVGKTSVVRRLAADAARAGATVLRAAAGELESQAPFGVVRQLFDRALAELSPVALDTVAQGPARVAVDFVRGEPPAGAEPSAPIEQSRMLNSLFWLVDGLAAHLPLLLAVDDAQWADEASLLFLTHLLGRIDDLPVLVVVAARDVQADRRSPGLAALVAHDETRATALAPFTPAGVRDHLHATYDRAVGPLFAATFADITGGNPFLVTELSRLLIGQGIGPGDDAVEQMRCATPPSVVDAVVRRLTALGKDEQILARVVAALRCSSLRVAAALAEIDIESAATAIDRLRDAGLLADGPELRFRHALLEAAVVEAAGVETQAQLHREAARLLVGEPGGSELAAGHLMATEGVGDPWAAHLLARAAGDALEAGAPQAAVALLRRAVAEPPEAEQLPGVLLRLGLAELRTADPACLTTLQRAERSVTDPVARARAALALAAAYRFAGFHERAADVLDPVLEGLADADGEVAMEVEAALLSASLLVPGRVRGARERLREWAGLAGATRPERLLLTQLVNCASGRNAPAEEIRAYAHRAVGGWPDPEQNPDDPEWVWPLLFLAVIGDSDDAVRLADDGIARSVAAGSVIGHVSAAFARGYALLAKGDLPGAEADYLTMLALGEELNGGILIQLLALGGLAEAMAEQGRLAEAFAQLAHLPEEFPDDAPVNAIILLLRARATARAAAGDHLGALAAARECARLVAALDVDSPTWVDWRALAVPSLWALGRVEEARRLAAEALAKARRSEVPRLIGAALRVTGQVAESEGLGLLREAVEVLEGSDARLEHAKALVALGSAQRRVGHKSEARRTLLDGRDLAARCGAVALVAEAEAELASAGGRSRRLEDGGAAVLTASERRVCELAATGMRNRDIAHRLFITPKTVEVHLSRSYRKLAISGRDELAVRLSERSAG